MSPAKATLQACGGIYSQLEDRFIMLIFQPQHILKRMLLNSFSTLLNPAMLYSCLLLDLCSETWRGNAVWSPSNTKHIFYHNKCSCIIKTNVALVKVFELLLKGGLGGCGGVPYLCSRLMSWSNSQPPAVLSNCISDAPLSCCTCPILLSHGLAASQQRKQSLDVERATIKKKKKKRKRWNTVNKFLSFFYRVPQKCSTERNLLEISPTAIHGLPLQAGIQCHTRYNVQSSLHVFALKGPGNLISLAQLGHITGANGH